MAAPGLRTSCEPDADAVSGGQPGLRFGRFDGLGRDDPARTFRLGIFGGTFDPIHMGHLAAAERVREDARLDAVLFMPAGVPVFKLDRRVSPGADRLAMCRLACAGNPHFEVTDLEVARAGNTYTVDTLREMRAHFPENVELHFIAGADAVATLGKWRDADELVRLARFIGMARPGYPREQAQQVATSGGRRLPVEFLEVPGLDISSSAVRGRVAEGKSIRYLVPEPVRDYIDAHNLYRA